MIYITLILLLVPYIIGVTLWLIGAVSVASMSVGTFTAVLAFPCSVAAVALLLRRRPALTVSSTHLLNTLNKFEQHLAQQGMEFDFEDVRTELLRRVRPAG